MRRPERLPLGLALTLTLALGLTACSTIHYEFGESLDRPAVLALSPGLSTRAEVMSRFGPPVAVAAHGDGIAFLYEYLLVVEQQFGISLGKPLSFIHVSYGGLFKAVLGFGDAHHEVAAMIFNARGILQAYGVGEWPEAIGRGGGMQFFVKVSPVVDSATYRESPLLLSSGRDLLDPLPLVQNQRYRAGLELRGTGRKAGQRTLELLPWNGDAETLR